MKRNAKYQGTIIRVREAQNPADDRSALRSLAVITLRIRNGESHRFGGSLSVG
jgi:hypothetical protein